ncbi:MAG: hypothetical protein KatS3mg019_0855 [Fimbriimonadales bacterium]|nr:MAG: hypothetical protein KatS3mg019_0855 [Fimbriimonadales bacterium]
MQHSCRYRSFFPTNGGMGHVWGVLLLLMPLWALGQPLQVHTHPTRGFQIAVPSNWQIQISDSDTLLEGTTPNDTSLYLGVNHQLIPTVMPTSSNYNSAIDGALSGTREALAEELNIQPENTIEIGRRIHKVGNLRVATLDLRAPTPQDWVFRTRLRLVLADQGLYVITFSGREEEFQQNEMLANQILDSFQPKNPQPAEPLKRALWVPLGVGCVGALILLRIALFVMRRLSQ